MARIVRTPDIVKHNWRFSANDLSGWSSMAKYDLVDSKTARQDKVNKLIAMRSNAENHPLESDEPIEFGNSILNNE